MRVNILGVGFDNITMDEALARGEALLAHALPLADECYNEIVKLIDG